MATRLIYLEDFDVVSCEATVIRLEKTEDERMVMILDQTCFYPRGGGQDWDTGHIKADESEFVVDEVRLNGQGEVLHIGRIIRGDFTVGVQVSCAVDTERRMLNTRLHTAGHLIDMALTETEPKWKPVKGAHYPHMSFVEYEVPEAAVIDESFGELLQTRLIGLQQATVDNQIRFMPKQEMMRYCRHVPDNIPTNKPTRIVIYNDSFGSPCGGTHVKKLSDTGEVTITKAKIKKGLAKISYAVAGIN